MTTPKILLASAVVAMLGLAACNDDAVAPTKNPPGAPTGLMASTLDSASVKITWTPVTGATSYKMAWVNTTNAADIGSIDSFATVFATATGLKAGQPYAFTVTARNADGLGTGTAITWATAHRYTQDQGDKTVKIRVYDKGSTKGSGLILDPANGGPTNAKIATGSGTIFGNVNLIMLPNRSGDGTLDIGPASAFTETANADLFDKNTYISKTTFQAPTMNDWYLVNSLDKYIDLDSGSIKTFNKIPKASANGVGFIVRTGVSPNFHYARVFIHSAAGSLIQTSALGDFVELEISYQNTANVPYAKRSAVRESPVGITSSLYRY